MEKSCGVILFTKKNGIKEYVLVMENSGNYSFPKGHIEKNETELECALREVYEETGVKPKIIDNLKRTIRYNISAKEMKEVIYFVGEYEGELEPHDKDILSCKSYPLDASLNLLKFRQMKDLLIEINMLLEMK